LFAGEVPNHLRKIEIFKRRLSAMLRYSVCRILDGVNIWATVTRRSRRAVKYPSAMTPPTKAPFEMLLGTKEHEVHHRGQLMLWSGCWESCRT
jgi:hypothetical protein